MGAQHVLAFGHKSALREDLESAGGRVEISRMKADCDLSFVRKRACVDECGVAASPPAIGGLTLEVVVEEGADVGVALDEPRCELDTSQHVLCQLRCDEKGRDSAYGLF